MNILQFLEVWDKKLILEFVHNIDKEIFETINNHLSSIKTKNELKALEFTTTEEQQAEEAPATYSMPLSFNQSDFFG